MRKKYLYNSYNASREFRGADVVADLFSDYYFSIEKTVGVFDAFCAAHPILLGSFGLLLISSLVALQLHIFLVSTITSLITLGMYSVLLVKWFSFKSIFRDLKENQIF